MHTEGSFSPESREVAVERYETLGGAAQTVVREVTRAMEFDREEYEDRVDGGVVETARDALFASMLRVTVGEREDYEAWLEDHPDYEAIEAGNENVDRVVWHAVPFADTVVAATFQNEERAAVDTLRRQAFGRVYRDAVSQ